MSDEKKAKSRKKPAPKVEKDAEGLNPQWLIFIGALIEMGFQRKGTAYLKAYPKCKESSADAAASRLLKNVKVRARIEREMNDMLAEKKSVLEHEIFNFWYVRMTYDPTEIIGLNGVVKMTEEELRKRGLFVCIESIKRKLNSQGDSYLEIELADRNAAAVRLDGYIHMTKPLPNVNLNYDKDVDKDMTPEEEAIYRENLAAAGFKFPQLGEKKE